MSRLIDECHAVRAAFDRSYAGGGDYFGSAPSAGVARLFRRLAAGGGAALELGSGDGRNALFLARLGFEVTAVDSSAAGITALQQQASSEGLPVRAVCADMRSFPLPRSRWDLVVLVTALGFLTEEELNPLACRLMEALTPGGYLVAEEFTRHDPGFTRAGPASEFSDLMQHYFAPGELSELFVGLDVQRYREFELHDEGHGRPHRHAMARFVGRKPRG
jgi:SAM-dependent methyltransferase